MPSPFHQKYSSQNHKFFGDNIMPSMPDSPKQDAERRESNASITSDTPSSPIERRRSSAAGRFANLEALKRPTDEASIARRSSLQDAYGKSGFIGKLWNSYTRGPTTPLPPKQVKEPRDITTLRQNNFLWKD